jgi:hypothetical protein
MSHGSIYGQTTPQGNQTIAENAENKRKIAIQEEYYRLQSEDPERFAQLPPLPDLMREPSAWQGAMAPFTGPDANQNASNAMTATLGSQFAGGLIPAAKQIQTKGIMSLLDPRMSPGQLNAGVPEIPMDEASRMARAREMGFDVDAYHGTGSDIDEFNSGVSWGSKNPELANEYAGMRREMGRRGDKFTDGDPRNGIAKLIERFDKDGEAMARSAYGASMSAADLDVAINQAKGSIVKENVMPLKGRPGVSFDADVLPKTVKADSFANELMKQARNNGVDVDSAKAKDLLGRIKQGAKAEESGPSYSRHDFWYAPQDAFGEDGAKALSELMELTGFDSIKMMEQGSETIGMLNPNQWRSKFAAFDPAKKDSANLMHGIGGLGAGGLMSQDEQKPRGLLDVR